MQIRSTRTHRLAPRASLFTACAVLAGASALRAIDTAPAADLAPVEPGEITRTVLDQGDHRTVLIEMVPEAVAPRAPSPAAPSSTPLLAASFSADESEPPAKPHHVLFWSVSVFTSPALASVIQGQTADQRPWRVISHLDFRLLRQLNAFETARATYDWLPAIGEADPQDPAMSALLASNFSATPPAYRVDPAGATPGPEVLDALDHLCSHYAARHAELLADYERREAEQALRERELRENPPPKPDLVVRYTTPVARPARSTASATR